MENIKTLFVVCSLHFIAEVTSCQSRWNKIKPPVLELHPSPNGNLIWVKTSDNKSCELYKKDLVTFLEPYRNEKKPSTVVDCKHLQQPPINHVCGFEVTRQFAPCLPEFYCNGYLGFSCVYLKLNSVPGWTPLFYNSTTLPKEMPDYLKDLIKRHELRGTHTNIWVTCDGQTSADKENIGPRVYQPFLGFSGKYFPVTDVKGYFGPLVAIFFERPKRNVLINIECILWAQNIPRDRENKLGILQFSLLIDD